MITPCPEPADTLAVAPDAEPPIPSTKDIPRNAMAIAEKVTFFVEFTNVSNITCYLIKIEATSGRTISKETYIHYEVLTLLSLALGFG
jgi:hypothetical protein